MQLDLAVVGTRSHNGVAAVNVNESTVFSMFQIFDSADGSGSLALDLRDANVIADNINTDNLCVFLLIGSSLLAPASFLCWACSCNRSEQTPSRLVACPSCLSVTSTSWVQSRRRAFPKQWHATGETINKAAIWLANGVRGTQMLNDNIVLDLSTLGLID